ncbi:Tetratricopeptide TPR_1 repeat-containing protein [Stanieria cyanosphaera PCC 7437]|uniref:Tetratricopeptide TPR_1 repeat-containing protein n=1 Tax=Stanieria cyanosphaera (strain ATCC 29371 / PCC 7437) TaxID=111780 RepID=K9XVM0_STAC7|nr:tetratricopeptide repeat protein [Stanieria cyanosphaera]AFZ35722.1 Tetratricopeptide TPR_1 repeat-containing protein [Stanieria cyanosphaera PCC 7437]
MNLNYLTQAIANCEAILHQQEFQAETWQQSCRDLGNLLQGLGRFDQAIVWHSLALESKPSLVEAYTHIGQLYVRESQWESAINCLKQALKYQPNSVQLYSTLAQIYNQLEEPEAEMECWYQATQINPNLVNAGGYHKLAKAFYHRNKLDEAINCYQRAIEQSEASETRQSNFEPHYELAEIWLEQRKINQAVSCYQQILDQDPNQSRAHHKLGTIYLRQQQFEEAITEFRQTIQIEPEFPGGYRDLVKTLIQFQKWDEAIATCHAIINLVEEYPWVYVQLGNALREKGRISDAIASFQKACVLKGWQECRRKDYSFTQDNFSYRISLWQSCLQSLANQADIQALEIGSHQGMSTCWLLDRILTHSSAKLTCIDSSFDRYFENNLDKTQARSKVTLMKGEIQQLLATLIPNTYDVVNLQDRCKLTTQIEQDAAYIWQLLKVEGIAIFNDYGWINPTNPSQNPKLGIDRFLESIKNQWEIVSHAPQIYQLIIQKKYE